MIILVCADSHGEVGHMIEAVEAERPDFIFFLGDHDRDGRDLARLYPQIPVSIVKGNCDWGPGEGQLLTELGGVRFLLLHGHQYGVKSGLDSLAGAGRRLGADVVCFGHTHRAQSVLTSDNLWLFNPGSVGGVHAPVSYGVLKVENGSVNARLARP